MGVIVQKFGGTSLKDSERVLEVAKWLIKTKDKGHGVVAVVSAQGKMTDHLIEKAKEVVEEPNGRELDSLLSVGEQISASLLAMAIEGLGHRAVSYTGHQLNIETTDEFNNAKILGIDSEKLKKSIDEDHIVIVTGFQGHDSAGNTTTLGRGGSDTTAVAIGAAIEADYVEIYTDVDGVYSADPRIVEKAVKIPEISYKEMIEMAGKGARVLHCRCVEMAAKYGIAIHLRSSYTWEEGTWIKEEKDMEKEQIRGITHVEDLGKVNIRGLKGENALQRVIDIVDSEGIEIQAINQGISAKGEYELSMLLEREEALKIGKIIDRELEDGTEVDVKIDLGMVSATGTGVRSNRLQGKVLRLIHELNVRTRMICSSDTSLSYVIASEDVARVKKGMHRELIEKVV